MKVYGKVDDGKDQHWKEEHQQGGPRVFVKIELEYDVLPADKLAGSYRRTNFNVRHHLYHLLNGLGFLVIALKQTEFFQFIRKVRSSSVDCDSILAEIALSERKEGVLIR